MYFAMAFINKVTASVLYFLTSAFKYKSCCVVDFFREGEKKGTAKELKNKRQVNAHEKPLCQCTFSLVAIPHHLP